MFMNLNFKMTILMGLYLLAGMTYFQHIKAEYRTNSAMIVQKLKRFPTMSVISVSFILRAFELQSIVAVRSAEQLW